MRTVYETANDFYTLCTCILFNITVGHSLHKYLYLICNSFSIYIDKAKALIILIAMSHTFLVCDGYSDVIINNLSREFWFNQMYIFDLIYSLSIFLTCFFLF